ncbi:Hypothetical predicted protein [Octopus vulgaris]|uniref:Uncharacterized protein n=1 Tax=Octopus vulgaris TaxID=6645 RepID=A0AA36AZG2_OCTVU|nr:Hypothetical predicted protein [Octopus vulgaris]
MKYKGGPSISDGQTRTERLSDGYVSLTTIALHKIGCQNESPDYQAVGLFQPLFAQCLYGGDNSRPRHIWSYTKRKDLQTCDGWCVCEKGSRV